MPAIATSPVTTGNKNVITHSANATTTDTSYTYSDPQELLIIYNKGLQNMQVTVNGVKERIHPNECLRAAGVIKNFLIKCDGGTHPFIAISERAKPEDQLLNSLRVRAGTPPALATSTGLAGEFIWANGFLYICVADNTWQRTALATW